MNRFIGAIFIVAGTTIGAGMLALPITGAPLGIFISIGLLFGMWVLMYYASRILLDVSGYFNQGLDLSAIVEKVWGRKASAIVSFCILGLFYPLLAAYIMGSASLIHLFLVQGWGLEAIPMAMVTVLTTLLFALMIIEIKFADYYNRILFLVKSMAFTGMLALLWPALDWEKILDSQPIAGSSLALALPIFFTSFGFHGGIPSIINYLGFHKQRCRSAFFWGSLIPLAIYIVWIIATVGILPMEGAHSFSAVLAQRGDVAVFIEALSISVGKPILKIFTSLFSFLAIATSLIGVGLGLNDFFKERIVTKSKTIGSILSILCTFILPMILALFYPQGFVAALGWASIALCIIAIIAPAAVALYLRRYELLLVRNAEVSTVTLWVLFIIGLGIIGIELMNIGGLDYAR